MSQVLKPPRGKREPGAFLLPWYPNPRTTNGSFGNEEWSQMLQSMTRQFERKGVDEGIQKVLLWAHQTPCQWLPLRGAGAEEDPLSGSDADEEQEAGGRVDVPCDKEDGRITPDGLVADEGRPVRASSGFEGRLEDRAGERGNGYVKPSTSNVDAKRTTEPGSVQGIEGARHYSNDHPSKCSFPTCIGCEAVPSKCRTPECNDTVHNACKQAIFKDKPGGMDVENDPLCFGCCVGLWSVTDVITLRLPTAFTALKKYSGEKA
jgi:hypothetical protein